MEKQGEYTIINLSGRLDIDKTPPFKDVCIKNFAAQRVIFRLDELSFVGSTGIHSFFTALDEIHKKNKFGCRIVGLSPDFKRFVGCMDTVKLNVHESVDQAMVSFQFSAVGSPTFDSTQG